LYDAGPHLGVEIFEQLFLLRNEIVGDARTQPLPLPGRAQGRRAPIARVGLLLDVTFPDERGDDAAGGAFVEEQALRQGPQAHGPVRHERLERVALRDRHVVTADAVAIAELIDADEVGDRRL